MPSVQCRDGSGGWGVWLSSAPHHQVPSILVPLLGCSGCRLPSVCSSHLLSKPMDTRSLPSTLWCPCPSTAPHWAHVVFAVSAWTMGREGSFTTPRRALRSAAGEVAGPTVQIRAECYMVTSSDRGREEPGLPIVDGEFENEGC